MKVKYWGVWCWRNLDRWFFGQTGVEFMCHNSQKVFTKQDIYRAYTEGFRQGRLRGRREMREELEKGESDE